MDSTTISPKILELLKKAVNETLNNFEVSVHNPNKKGQGFLGQIFFVSLTDKSTGNQLHFVVKQAFSEKIIRDSNPIRDVFVNEIHFYTKVWPKFSRFQEQIPSGNRFIHLAKYFASSSEENLEMLLLENLKYQGFEMHEKKKPLEKEKFEYIFKVYGKFHAISFAYKVMDPEGFSELVRGIHDTWVAYTQKEGFRDIIRMSYEKNLEYFQPGVDDAVIEKFKHYVDNGVDLFCKSLGSGKYSAIIHGDCWSNNMMFKYDDSGELTDIRLLDFQMFRLGSPVCDLSYCLYSGGTKEIFDHLDDLLQVYHDSLSESLRAYGCDPNDLYPLEALKNDWKVYGQMGITMGLRLWRGKLTYDANAIDLSDTRDDEEGVKKFLDVNYDKETYRKIIRGVVYHCYERGYLV